MSITLVILASVLPLPGQDEENEVKKWTGNASLGLSLSQGNSDTQNISFDFTADHRISQKVEWRNNGLLLLGKVDKITSKETYQLYSGINWHHSERILTYYSIQGIRDLFKNYNYRFLPGVGVGYKILIQEKFKLTLTGGLSLVATEYHDTGDRSSYAGIDFSDEFTWNISENAQFNQKWRLNFNLQDLNHALWQFEANFITMLVKSLAVKLTFINSHDSKPVGEGIKKDDYSFLAGISMKF